jgi:hypothetical protein
VATARVTGPERRQLGDPLFQRQHGPARALSGRDVVLQQFAVQLCEHVVDAATRQEWDAVWRESTLSDRGF